MANLEVFTVIDTFMQAADKAGMQDAIGVASAETSFGVTTSTATDGSGGITKVVWDTVMTGYGDAGGAMVIGSGGSQSRFTPTVAGRYHFDVNIGSGDGVTGLYLSKNGTIDFLLASGSSGSVDVVANGTTDYFELNFANGTISTDNRRNYWTGHLVHAS